jgi:hypothetical protein
MQIELITVVGGSQRWAPNWCDRAWVIMENKGSGADGASQARAGDATCLLIGTGVSTYTDSGGVTRSVQYQAKEAETGVAPEGLLLGGWHDTPAVGDNGRVQCYGVDNDARVLPDSSPGLGIQAIAVTAEPYVLEQTTTVSPLTTGCLATIVERTANMTASTQGNHAVFWRCC